MKETTNIGNYQLWTLPQVILLKEHGKKYKIMFTIEKSWVAPDRFKIKETINFLALNFFTEIYKSTFKR